MPGGAPLAQNAVMTDTRAQPARNGQRPAVTLLVVTVVLLLPLALGLGYAAESAAHHRSATDWKGNHATKLALQHAAALLFFVPVGSAAAGWGGAAVLRRHQGAGA